MLYAARVTEDEIRIALRDRGASRTGHQIAAREDLDAIIDLAQQALGLGITKSAISELTGISRVTLNEELAKRRAGK